MCRIACNNRFLNINSTRMICVTCTAANQTSWSFTVEIVCCCFRHQSTTVHDRARTSYFRLCMDSGMLLRLEENVLFKSKNRWFPSRAIKQTSVCVSSWIYYSRKSALLTILLLLASQIYSAETVQLCTQRAAYRCLEHNSWKPKFTPRFRPHFQRFTQQAKFIQRNSTTWQT
jgi:hypothetical protein